ncbi:MAG: entericidin A/B family lipoprotein [Verrucomicrobia bacterium]|nr:entericidin A/B family lipoprotein [Verrucomicrobiota bacterium]
MKRLLFTALALVAMMVLSACNTVRGVGQDVRSLGRGIERASDTP